MGSERLWTRSYILMIAATALLFTSFYMLYPTLPQFITKIGGTDSDVGLAMGVFMLASVLCRPLVGGLLDRYGRRPFIVIGFLLFSVAMYLYGWVGGVVGLMGLRVLHGVSWAFSSTANQTAITDMIPTARRGEGLGWLGMAMTLAMAVGPAIGLWIEQSMSFRALFLLGTGLSSMALLLTLGARMPVLHMQRTIDPRSYIPDRSMLPIMAAVFFVFVAYSSVSTFLPLFTKSINVNSGIFFLVFAATLGLTRPLGGRLSDRFGEAAVIAPALAIAVLGMIALSLSGGLLGVLISAVLFGIGYGSAQPVLQSFALRLVGSNRRGMANASVTTATDLGIGLGAMMLGTIAQHTSYRGVFIVAAASVAASLLVFSLGRRLVGASAIHTDRRGG